MEKICICGAGTMGSGIAQVSATAGFETILYESIPEVLNRAKANIQESLEKLVSKQKISAEEMDKSLSKIHFTSNINECIADIFIEAIIENKEAKAALFQNLASLNSNTSIFASNTSSLSISELAEETPFPEQFAGIHFFNPPTIMKLVEVIHGNKTSTHILERLVKLTREFGKTPVICKDAPGFIVNRVARPYYIESLRLIEENASDFPSIDRILESKGFKMGPFKLMDLIGNDVNYAVSCSVYEQLGKPKRLKPSLIQKERVDKKELGKKSGKGYYNYN